LVVDASVAVKWLIYEDTLSDEAEAIARSNHRLVAPRILLTEVANALVRRANRGELEIDTAVIEYRKLSFFFDEIVAIDDLLPVAMRNAHRFQHPIYDLIYVEIAARRDTKVVTADQRLAAKLSGTPLAEHVILLSDWRAA
jgi:predicted nucleic acid-binding protein